MNLGRLFFTLSVILLFNALSIGQIDMTPANTGTTYNTCSDFLIDSGGQGGPGYGNNENVTITICPDTPGEIISVQFNLFDLDPTNLGTQQNPNMDYMAVYDGTSTAANTLGTYFTNELQGVVIEATALNASGCITLQFYSNATGTGMFTASVSCETPCADPQAGGVIVGGITPDSIRVCVGELVNFQESGSMAQPGFNLVDYEWDFMDGTTGNGQSVSHAFTSPGQFRVQLFVTDDNGCSNPNLIDLEVLVATYPDFSTFPGDTSICLGESITFEATPEDYEVLWNGFPGSQTVDDGCLPDTLLGVSQDVQLLQTGFSAGTTITDVNDIESICLDLEHSYMGDLVIMIECPNGQNAILHQQGGGGTQIGVPVQADNVDCSDPATMGTPFTYCFTPSATDTWVDWVNNQGGFGNTIPAGNYASVDPLDNLVGCPTNGVWTLTVIDNWAADDGTLFGFGLTLDPSYYPPVTQFEPQIGSGSDSSFWVNPQFQTFLSPDANIVTVTPTIDGQFPYTYSITNDFGCTEETSLMLTVTPPPTIDAGNDTTLCNGSSLQLEAQVTGVMTDCYSLVLDDTFGDGWNGNTITVSSNTGGSETYTLTTGSTITIPISVPVGETVTVTFNANGSFISECQYSLVDNQNNTIISQPNLSGVQTSTFVPDCVTGMVYEWTPTANVSNPSIIDPMYTSNGPSEVIFTTYPVGHQLCAISDTMMVNVSATPDPGQDSSLQVCITGQPVDLFPLLGAGASPNGSWLDPNGVAVTMPFDPQTMPIGVYTHVVDSNGCTAQATITITEVIAEITNVVVTNVTCQGFTDGSFILTGNNFDAYSIDGGQSVNATSPFTVPGLGAGSYNVEVTNTLGCVANQVVDITEPDALTASAVVTNASCFGECDGAVQVTPTGGTVPYTYTWNGGVNGDQNGNAAALCAGDYSLQIVDDNACTFDVNFTVTEPANVIPNILGDTLVGCFPHTVNFANATVSNDIATTTVDYGDGLTEVVNGLDAFSHEYETPGTYTVSITMETVFGCTYSVVYTDLIVVHDNPVANFWLGPNPVSMFDPTISLTDLSSGDVNSWSWSMPDATPSASSMENVSKVTYPTDTLGNFPITLIVESEHGCTDTIVKELSIVNEVQLMAPNSFTPDNDEFNQTWNVHVLGVDIYNIDLRIYNKWGEVIWESHDVSVGWDGTYKGRYVETGTYQWVMNCADVINDNKYTFTGHVNVLR